MTKTCTKCGEDKALVEFSSSLRKTKSGPRMYLRSECKSCSRARIDGWVKVHPGKARARKAKWQKDNPGKARGIRKRWKDANPDGARNIYSRSAKKAISELSDRYLKSLIVRGTTIKHKCVPDSLVRLKRAQIKLLREVKKHEDQERGTT